MLPISLAGSPNGRSFMLGLFVLYQLKIEVLSLRAYIGFIDHFQPGILDGNVRRARLLGKDDTQGSQQLS